MFVEFLNGEKVTQRNFNLDIGFFLGLGDEEKWYVIDSTDSWWVMKSTAKVKEKLFRNLSSEEVNTPIRAFETYVQAARNRFRDRQEKFENLSKEITVSQTCETVGFIGTVCIGQYFRTIHDGLGGKTGSWRKYTVSRDISSSELVGWIRRDTKIGPVCQVRVTCYLDQYGIEIQIPSKMKNGYFFCSMTSRRSKPLRGWMLTRSRKATSQDVEMVSSTSVEQSHAITTSIEESNTSKQQRQSSISLNYLSQESIPIDKRKWIHPVVDNVKRVSLALKASKTLTFVRHRRRNR